MKKGVGQSEKLFHWNCKGAGAMQNDPCPKTKQNAFFDLLLQKMSGQPSANSQNQPLKTPHFAPFPKVRKITQIISHWLSVHCKQYFVFLRFCVFVFWILTAKWGATEKDSPQGGRLKGVFNKCWFWVFPRSCEVSFGRFLTFWLWLKDVRKSPRYNL